MLYQNSTSVKPLLFFETFVKKVTIEKYENMFFNSPINPSQTFNIEEGYIEYFKDLYSGEEEIKLTRIYFVDNLKSLLDVNLNLTLRLIEEREYELAHLNSKSDVFIESLLTKLNKLKENLPLISKYNSTVVESVNFLESNLLSKLGVKRHDKKPIIFKSSKTYFDLKEEVFPKHLRKLYAMTVNLEIIDYDLVTEEDFINIFCASLLPLNDIKFTFSTDNRTAITYLNTIRPFFKDLTVSRIASSKTFYTKQNSKVLNENDINKVNSYLRSSGTEKYDLLTKSIKAIFPKGI
ncbi:hypothetical protein [Flavobacterium sp. 3HN19-14]|uniref:hypothetical protein n=1 Tax=Flavobacterium sp. 3HN19-14 TaxID=3448133 RepID=UPI003EE00402